MKTNIIERARRYLARMEPAVSGSGGRAALFKAALALVKGFGLSEEDALPLLQEWNAGCLPPWTDKELAAVLRDAGKANKPAGYLLQNDDHRPKHGAGSRNFPPIVRGREVQARIDAASRGQEIHGEKARQRALWPTFRRPTDNDVVAVAKVRKLPVEAVGMARAAEFLWSATVDGSACFVISEGGHFAQAMRYDGLPFALPGEPKKKSLPGSLAKGFIGWSRLGDPACPTLLVEGVIGLLEGIAASRAVDGSWNVLAAISCHSRFADESFPMPDLAGRRFRILPDHDEAGTGFRAAAAWQMELEDMGASVDAYGLPPDRPPECKDIGPIAANTGRHLAYLTQLFSI